jgi:2-oxo-3-hexenedioate decarboxylase
MIVEVAHSAGNLGGNMTNDDIIQQLLMAVESRTATTPITNAHPDLSVDEAYDIQAAIVDARLHGNCSIVGAKLGLTSEAKQRQMNVSEPLYGWLTSEMQIESGGALVCSNYIQPRCEPEIAFLLKDDLYGSDIGTDHVLAATAYVLPAIDVLDSRFVGYTFTIADVVADNASSAGFILGEAGAGIADVDLPRVQCSFYKNGQLLATATGAAVLGHPAASVAWMVRALARRGEGLRAGQIVLSGALTEATPVKPGDEITAEFDGLGSITVPCR